MTGNDGKADDPGSTVSRGMSYVGSVGSGVYIFDVSDPTNPGGLTNYGDDMSSEVKVNSGYLLNTESFKKYLHIYRIICPVE